jgi:hypothetical protein
MAQSHRFVIRLRAISHSQAPDRAITPPSLAAPFHRRLTLTLFQLHYNKVSLPALRIQ